LTRADGYRYNRSDSDGRNRGKPMGLPVTEANGYGDSEPTVKKTKQKKPPHRINGEAVISSY